MNRFFRSLSFAALAFALLVVPVACGGGSPSEPIADGGPDGSPDSGDVDSGDEDAGPECPVDPALGEPPTVVSISPEDGAAGVGQFEPVVITFSESMDEESTEEAITYATTGHVGSLGLMTWNEDSTVLTINAANVYAFGVDTGVAAYEYTYTVGACAKNAAGNYLGAESSTTFATARGIMLEITEEVDPLFGHSTDGGSRFTFLCAGERDPDAEARALVTYDLSGIPEDNLGFANAFYQAGAYQIIGDPFEDFGALLIEHVTFETFAAGFNVPKVAGHELLPLLNAGAEVEIGDQLTQNVTLAVEDDWENRVARGYRSQFRFRFADAPSADGERDAFCMRAGDTLANEENGTPFIEGARLWVTYLIE